MDNPLEIIDQQAAAIARSLSVAVLAIEGLYEKYANSQTTPRGIGLFWAQSRAMIDDYLETAVQKVLTGYDALRRSLASPVATFISEQQTPEQDAETARATIGTLLEQSRTHYVKRLRNLAAAKAFPTAAYMFDPRVMDRAGRTSSIGDYAYLAVRQLLVDWYNQAMIGYMVEIGVSEFRTWPSNGVVYQVSEYPNLTNELFHPRTTRLVGDP